MSRNGFASRWIGLILATVVGLITLPPLLAVFIHGMSDINASNWRWPSFTLIARTAAWAGGIAAIGACIGVPLALSMGQIRGTRLAFLWTPLLIPSYLAYSGITVLRAPGSFLGDLLGRLSASGHYEYAAFAGQLCAVLALVLWIWPVLAVSVALTLSRIDPGILDALRLDAGRWSRLRTLLVLTWRGTALGWLVATIMMVGSCVPLHLAQVRTVSILVWLELQQSASPARALLIAWPCFAAAALIAWWLCRGLFKLELSDDQAQPRSSPGRISRWTTWAPRVMISSSVGGPFLIHLFTLKEFESLARFWQQNGEAVAASLRQALAVGVVCTLLGGLFAVVAAKGFQSRRSRGIGVKLAVWALVVAALLPGVFIGAGWSLLGNWLPERLRDSWMIVVIVHVCRFGAVGACAGLVCAAMESKELADLRGIDGVSGIRGWLWSNLGWQWPMLVAGGIAAAAMSFHEIESAVFVQPPGHLSLAQRMLNDLHQLRMDSLSAAAIWLAILGVTGAALTAWFWTAADRVGKERRRL